MIKYAILLFIVGCATHGNDRNEQIEIYKQHESECSRNGGHMVIQRTGSRIRRGITSHELTSARCRRKSWQS